MSVLFWVAAAWLCSAIAVTLAVFGAKHSRHLHGLLFGDRAGAEVARLPAARTAAATVDRDRRLAA